MMSSPLRFLVLALAGSALILAALSGCKSEAPHQQALPELPPIAVSVAAVEAVTPPRQTQVMATVEAAQSASIETRISGNISELPVFPGSRVSRGDTLVVISADEIEAQLNQAQAQQDQARRNLKREQNLLSKNAATPESVKTLEEQAKMAEAAYREARTMVDYTTIKAPFDGIVTAKPANVGDLATPGRTLLRLESESSLQVIASIPEALVLELSIGDQIPIEIEAAGVEVVGAIIEIAPTADPNSRSAPIKLRIPASENVRSGQFARVILPGSAGTALMIPSAAVSPFGQLERVFVAQNDTVRLQLVKTGLLIDDRVEVLSGLSEGDRVIVSDSRELSDGRKIIVQ